MEPTDFERMTKVLDFKLGDKVRQISEAEHLKCAAWTPKVGIEGTVTDLGPTMVKVKWPEGSLTGRHISTEYWQYPHDLEIITAVADEEECKQP